MYDRILVPLDGSENANAALREAVKLAKKLGSILEIVSVATDQRYVQYGVTLGQDVMESFQKRAEEILAKAKQLASDEGVESETHFVIGVPKQAISKELPQRFNTQLTVVGKSGVNGISRALLGSTTEYVVRHSVTHVLVIE